MLVDQIMQSLETVAREEGVRILYACESGSRAWGFASADSDYDVRFLYARPAREYLRLTPPPDTLEQPILGDLDLAGWDIFKACRLLRKSNPPLLEWLGSPILYREEPAAARLREIGRGHFSRRAGAEHYLSMANMNHRSCVGLARVVRKKYLYVLRPLTCARWLAERETFPPTAFEEVLAGVDLPADVRAEAARLVADKKVNREMGEGPANPVLQEYLEQELKRLTAAVRGIPPSRFPEQPLNDWIAEALGAE